MKIVTKINIRTKEIKKEAKPNEICFLILSFIFKISNLKIKKSTRAMKKAIATKEEVADVINAFILVLEN